MSDPIVRIGPAAHYHVDHRGQPVGFDWVHGPPREHPTPLAEVTPRTTNGEQTASDIGGTMGPWLFRAGAALVLLALSFWLVVRYWEATEGGR